MDTTEPAKQKESTPKQSSADEVANVAVDVLTAGTKIGKAICGRGRCSFPLTASQAKTLESLGKVRIVGTI